MLNTFNYILMYEERNYDTVPENDKVTSLTSLHQDYIALYVGVIVFSLTFRTCSQLKIVVGYKVILFFS